LKLTGGARTYFRLYRNSLSGEVILRVKWWTEEYNQGKWSVLDDLNKCLVGGIKSIDIPRKTVLNYMSPVTFNVWVLAMRGRSTILTVSGRTLDSTDLDSYAQVASWRKNGV